MGRWLVKLHEHTAGRSGRVEPRRAGAGLPKLDVHLGGSHDLERITVDSKRDHPTVV
jgi:hypothetical protein